MVWKNRENFFHCVEKNGRFFHSVETFFHTVEKSGHFFHGVETFFPRCGKLRRPRVNAWGALALLVLVSGAGAAERPSVERPPIDRLAIWCEFLPYAEVEAQLPVLATYDCDLILHVERESFADPDFAKLLRAAARAGVGVDAWLLLPYQEHLYVGQASVKATRALARQAADFFGENNVQVRAFVFDCEPSPLAGARAVRGGAGEEPAATGAGRCATSSIAEAFRRDTAEINGLITELRGRGYAVDGAANRAFLDAQSAGQRGARRCAERAGERGGMGRLVVHHLSLPGEPAVVCGAC